MRISRSVLKISTDPKLIDFVEAVARNNARSILSSANLAALTDSSTGTAGSTFTPVLTVDTKVVLSGTNLSPRDGFNTAIGVTDNAIAVLATYFNVAFTALGIPLITLGTGNVVTPATIPAQTKTIAGVDGTAGNGMLRFDANAALVRARNNFSTLIRAYNTVAVALGVATIADNTGGSVPGALMVVGAKLTAGTAISAGAVATSDLASKAGIDAALTALANNIATLAAKTSNPLFLAGTLTARIPHILVP